MAVIVVLLATLAWWLGEWQFHRLTDRKARNAQYATNVAADPTPAAQLLAPGRGVSQAQEWRRVTATGSYLPDKTVLVRYQTRKSTSGVDVVVPFRLETGETLLIDRGWLMAPNTASESPEVPPPPSGRITVVGWVRSDGTGSSTRVDESGTRAVSSATIGEFLGTEVLGGWVQVESEDGEPAADLLPAELPDPGNGPHFFYGLQWWFFGVLAVGGYGYLAYDEFRKRKTPHARSERDASPAGS
ncbi:MAG: SURF1 family protein [Nocardioides sp.]